MVAAKLVYDSWSSGNKQRNFVSSGCYSQRVLTLAVSQSFHNLWIGANMSSGSVVLCILCLTLNNEILFLCL